MLTQQQFQNLRNKGLSVEQIIKFEKGEIPKMRSKEQQKGFGRKVFDFFTKSEQAFGETLGGAMATGYGEKLQAESTKRYLELGNVVEKQIKRTDISKERKKQIFDQYVSANPKILETNPSLQKTAKQFFGEGLGVAVDILGAGSLQRKGLQIAKAPVSGIIKGIKAGAKTGAKAGVGFGSAQGIARSMQEDKDIMGIVGGGITGGLAGGITGGIIGGAMGGLSGGINRRKEIKNLLNQTKKPVEVVKYKIEFKPSGKIKVKTDKIAKEAVDKGIAPNRVNLIKNASKEDKNIFKKMFNLAERSSKDLTVEERPVQLAGNSLLDRAKYVLGKKRVIGQQLNKTVSKMTDKPINLNNVYDDFVDDLNNAGVKIKEKGLLDFRGSRFANTASTQRQIQNLYSDIKPNTAGEVLRTPQRINTIRQKLFDDLSLGKRGGDVSDSGMTIMTKTRSNLLKQLENLSGEFKKQNTSYAKIMQSLQEFNKLMGKDFNIEHDLANLRASEVINRLASNVPARPTRMISNLEDVAIELGYKKTSDIRTQVLFADMMEDLFGIEAPRGFGGQIQRSTEKAMEGMGVVEDIANKNIGTLITKTLRKIRGITPEKQIEVIKKLIFD